MTYIMPYVSFKESDCYIYNDDDKGLVWISLFVMFDFSKDHSKPQRFS